jgi:hypothetical protein
MLNSLYNVHLSPIHHVLLSNVKALIQRNIPPHPTIGSLYQQSFDSKAPAPHSNPTEDFVLAGSSQDAKLYHEAELLALLKVGLLAKLLFLTSTPRPGICSDNALELN